MTSCEVQTTTVPEWGEKDRKMTSFVFEVWNVLSEKNGNNNEYFV